MDPIFFAEVLSHASFFLAFLTVFYFFYVGLIQQKSMVNELTFLSKDFIHSMVLLLPPEALRSISDQMSSSGQYVDPILDKELAEKNASNADLMNKVFIGAFSVAVFGVIVSFITMYLAGGSVIQLLYSNIITIVIIGVTELILVAIYGQFRILDNEFLIGSLGVKAAGGTLDCNIVRNKLDSMFPSPFFQSIIHAIMDS